jgi:hypothetical protein
MYTSIVSLSLKVRKTAEQSVTCCLDFFGLRQGEHGMPASLINIRFRFHMGFAVVIAFATTLQQLPAYLALLSLQCQQGANSLRKDLP